MKTRKMRLLSFVLAVAMMFAVMPVSAFAEDSDPMGKEIPHINESGTYGYKITEPGIYQMKGTYTTPINIDANGDVIINITGNVDFAISPEIQTYIGPGNYAIRALSTTSTVTINNDNNYMFTVKGTGVASGALRVNPSAHMVVNGGTYITEEATANSGKELFYNYQGEMELNNVNAKGEFLVKNNGGTTTITGGSYERNRKTRNEEYWQGAIINAVDGTLTLNNVDVCAEQGSALLNLGGKNTINGGTFATKDENYSAICAYTDKGQFTNDKGNVISDGASQGPAEIEIDDVKVKDSNRGLEVKDGKIKLKNVAFENNGADIYLNDGQKVSDVVDTTGYTGKPLNAKVVDANGNTTLDVVKPADLTVEGGTVKVDASSIGDEEVVVNKDGNITKASVPVKARVTVTYDEAAYKDGNMEFNGWTIEGLANAEDYKNQQSFTFEMPANNVTIKVLPSKAAASTAPAEDDSMDAAAVVTGVVLGTGTAILAYHIGTEVYAEQVLGKGVAIPRTREEVALKAWELAGKPAVELNGEPLSEAAQAEKWAVESGLMQNVDGSFNGSKKMSKLKALRTLDAAKKLG